MRKILLVVVLLFTLSGCVSEESMDDMFGDDKYYTQEEVNELLEECRLERDWYWEEVKQNLENL